MKSSEGDILEPTIYRGMIIDFIDDPFVAPSDKALRYLEDGALLVSNGKIRSSGDATQIIEKNKNIPIVDLSGCLISAGFIDTHIHYTQMDIIGAHNHGLIDWLDRHAFPAEMVFENEEIASEAAEEFLKILFRNGVTSASVYCSVHPESVNMFFEKASAYNAFMVAGKVCMDRGAPPALLDSAKSAYDQSKILIDKWHKKGRARYAITPRFALSSTREQLENLGALWGEYPDVLMQTHLAETREEISRVRELHPDFKDYFDVYETTGLAKPGGIYGHCIHLEKRERSAMAACGATIAHCPTSNAFLGSGVFDLGDMREATPSIPVSLASDVGGGTSFSPFATMQAAYFAGRYHEIHIEPAQLFYMATQGAAKTLCAHDIIGALQPGSDADFVVLDPLSTPLLSRMTSRSNNIDELLMAFIMGGDDRCVRATYISGVNVI